MTVEIWIGQEFDTPQERKALHHFRAQMNDKFGQSDDLYLILANYYVDGRQIDLTVLKKDAAIVIELKECSDPFRATENGPWLTANGVEIGTGGQNPFEQAKDYRFRLINLLQENWDKFILSGKARSMNFYHVSAFVAISPILHPDSEIHLPGRLTPWFQLVGLDQLSDAVHHQTSRKLNFSHEELRKLAVDVLNLKPANTTPSNVALSNAVPNQVGRYQIGKMLGQGGMGTVYQAYDPELDREVVVKFITPAALSSNHEEWRDRFRREVQTASRFNHPHIITIHDVSLDHEPPYVVMELLTGGTLEDRLKQKPLSWYEALTLLQLLAQALGYAHQAGVIHRDVKPANIMFAGDAINTLKLVDFGLARWQNAEGLTQAGTTVGTPAYMSPEQALGESVDHRTDIFALGIILFETITGFNPLRKESPAKTLIAATSHTQIDTSPLVDKAPPEVIKLIEQATAKDCNQRYQTCEQLLIDLDLCLNNMAGIPKSITYHTSIAQTTKHLSATAKVEIEPPYGTMRPDSTFYIERIADEHCGEAINRSRAATLFVQAPRQMGKSSLVHRALAQAKIKLSKRSAFIDFQHFPSDYFSDEENFLIEFCLMIGDALHIPETIDQYWQGRRTNIVKCSRYLTEYIIPQIDEPFILAMDEVERMLASPFQDNFFGMLRIWHNDRVRNSNLAKMSLFLSSSTEPYLFIENPNQSPFNVAETIALQDFTQTEVEELNRRHQLPLNDDQLGNLMDLLNGHPFLTRLALYQLATEKIDFETLLAQATEDTGLFGDHLRHYLLRVLKKTELKQAMRDICRDQAYEENQIFYRLKGAGLIKKVGQQVTLRNNLYAKYFGERFNA